MSEIPQDQTESVTEPEASPVDRRLYMPYAAGWDAHVKQGWERIFCYSQNPGEDFFHRIVAGEIYVTRGDEKYCLNCALRLGFISLDRLHWQKGSGSTGDE